MAGEGEKKRKAGLDIDFDVLLGRDDEPPPELTITGATGKPIPPEDAEEADDYSNSNIKNFSDEELIDKSRKWRIFLRDNKLKDGGDKLRLRLEKVEAESKGRERLKDANKCERVIALADEPTRNGPTNVLSQSQAQASLFGTRFCSHLDNDRPKSSSGEELFTLNRSDHINIGQHKSSPAPITQKKGLSSRQTAYKCPSHLSGNIDNQQQTNREQRGSHDSDPFSHLSDIDAFCRSTKKDFGGHNLRYNSRRNNRSPFVIVDEEELEDDVVDDIDPPTICSKDSRIYYPSRYLQKPTSPSVGMERGIHIFNTFFYEKLKQDVLTKNINVFDCHRDFLSGSFLVEERNFLRKENVLPEPFTEHIWDKLSQRINEKVTEVPQQENGYDCGLFVLFFMERFIDEAPRRSNRNLEFGKQWFIPKEASRLRRKIRDLLREQFRNANENAC